MERPIIKNQTNDLDEDKRVLEFLRQAPQIMIWATDEHDRAIYGNKAITDTFDFPAEIVTGFEWLEVIHPDDQEKALRTRELASKHHRVYRQELRAKKKNGEYIWTLDVSAPRFSPEGKFLGYVGSTVDITDLKNYEEDLKRKKECLEKEVVEVSDREQSRIGQDLHDGFSQHLLGIALKLKSTFLEKSSDNKNSSELQTIQEMILEINQLILKTRQISQSLFPVALGKKDFGSILKDLADQIHYLSGVILTFKNDVKIALDPEKTIHLYRIIQEAVTNSIRHGLANNIDVSLKAVENGKILLEIKDDGIGIPEKPKSSEGMGLHIMEYRAKTIGGTISVRKHENNGTVVSCCY